jgi:uncharacterized protein (TIGR03437 family)
MKIPGSLALKLCLCLVTSAAVAAATTPPSLSASPAAVDFEYTSGQPQPLPVNVIVTASNGSSPVLSFTRMPTTGSSALLFPTSAIMVEGDTISVGYDVNELTQLLNQPGTYTATLTISAAGFPSLNIPLTFVVGGDLTLIPSPATLSFTAPPAPANQTVSLTGAGGASIGFSVTSDSTWLSATANPGYTPSTLTVTVNALNLPTGTYQGNIIVTPTQGSPLQIPVALQVGTNTLTAMPDSLAFAFTVGGTIPPAQVVQVSSPLSNNTYTAQANSTGNWLLVNGVTTNVSGALPASLNVTVNPSGLGAGNYQGTIAVTDADNNTQNIAVALDVASLSNVANPASLVFLAQTGGMPPSTQTVSVNGFGSATYTATVTGGAWLSVSSSGGLAPAQVIVAANPAGLVAGTYSGAVEINLDSHIQNIQVTFIVSTTPVLTTNPGSFILSYAGGSAPPSPLSLDIGVTGGADQSFTVATGTPAWLQIGPGGTLVTQADLTVTLEPLTLATGTYLAQIIVTPTSAGGIPAVVPVLLTVVNATPVVPNVTSLSFSAVAGGAPQSQTVDVTAASATPFTATTSTAIGGSWLSVSPVNGDADLTTTVIVTADASDLAKGTYTGTVTLTTAGGVVSQIAVTFTVAGSSVPVTVAPSTLAFAYTQGGTVPAAQTVQVTGAQSFTATASTSGGGSWLAVTPASGTGIVTLSVSVNPAGLAPGVYSGSIAVTPTGGTAQTVAVTLTVSATGLLAAAPSSLAFAYAAGNPSPAAQTVSVTSTGQAVTFTATASSSGWLSVTQSAATTPASLTVTVNPANLGAGSYNGSIALNGGSGVSQLNISVVLTVTAPLPVIGAVTNAASYLEGAIAPGEIVTIFGTALGPAASVSATIDSKGFIETALANVTVTFNGYPGPILYASATQINAIVPYELAGASSASVEAIFGTARSNSATVPVAPAAPGIFSANASGQGPGAILDTNYHLVSTGNPVSPGSIIQIFATGEGQTAPAGVDGLIEPLTLPLPAPLLDAQVTIGGVPANIQYVGAAPGEVAGALQINAFVPGGLPPGPALLVVSFGGIYGSQPGITVAIQ